MGKDGELGSAQRPGETVEGQQIEEGGVICLKLGAGSGGNKKALPFFSNQLRQWKTLLREVVSLLRETTAVNPKPEPSRLVTEKEQALRNKTD